MRGQAMDRYRHNRVATATPAELVGLLFDAGISAVEAAAKAIDEGRPADVHTCLVRAQDIVTELRCSLKLEAGDVARNLDMLYEYVHRLLVEANVRKERRQLAEVVSLLTPLRDAWREACLAAAAAS